MDHSFTEALFDFPLFGIMNKNTDGDSTIGRTDMSKELTRCRGPITQSNVEKAFKTSKEEPQTESCRCYFRDAESSIPCSPPPPPPLRCTLLAPSAR